MEEILQMRIVKDQRLHARREKQYLVRWTPSLLSATELHYAQKTWKIVKASRDVHAQKGEAVSRRIRVQWGLLWVSCRDFGPRVSGSETASYLLD